MSHQHRTTPARATFALEFNANNDDDANVSNERFSSDLVGSGIQPSTDFITPTRRSQNFDNLSRGRPVRHAIRIARPSVCLSARLSRKCF